MASGTDVDLSITTYVNDVAKRQIASTFAELARPCRTVDKKLYDLCVQAGLAPNDSNKEVV